MSYIQWLINALFLVIVGVAFVGFIFWKRSANEKFMANRIIAEIWLEKGHRRKIPLLVEPNGIEVKAPEFANPDACPRYLFDHSDIDDTSYPENAMIGGTRCHARTVSWFEGNPEPINRTRKKPLVSAQLIDTLRDNDFLTFATAASREIEILQRQLQDALKKGMNKSTVMALIMIGILASGAAAAFGYFTWQGIELLKWYWGIG